MYKIANANGRVDIKDLLQLLANADLRRCMTSKFTLCRGRLARYGHIMQCGEETSTMEDAAPVISDHNLTNANHKHTCAASLLADLVQMHNLSCFALTLTTTPQISSPSVNCSPMHASSCSANAHILQSCNATSDIFPRDWRCASSVYMPSLPVVQSPDRHGRMIRQCCHSPH